MQAQLLVASAVTHHPDGTFSALRVGLDQFYNPNRQPVAHPFVVLVRISHGAGEGGDHEIRLSIRGPEGRLVVPEEAIGVRFEKRRGSLVHFAPFELALQPGEHSVILDVDRVQLASWPFTVFETHAQQPPPVPLQAE